MKLERNRAERRSKRGVPILYKGIPYLIFAALASGFLLGSPQMIATSSIAQAARNTQPATGTPSPKRLGSPDERA